MAKYLENLVTYRYDRDVVDVLRAELDDYTRVDKEGKDSNIASQKKLSQIEYHLAKANGLYYKRKFQEALKEYKYVQALVHKMLDPGIKPGIYRNPKFDIAINPAVFDPLLKTSLEMIEVMTPPKYEGVFASGVAVLPADVLKSTELASAAGVMPATGMNRLGHNAMMTGIEYAERGEWEKSELFFKQALKSVGQASTSEKKASKATLELNLGYVQAQQGKLAEAQKSLSAAGTDFKAAKDPVGEANATLSTAAILSRKGNTAGAEKTMASATKMLENLELSRPASATTTAAASRRLATTRRIMAPTVARSIAAASVSSTVSPSSTTAALAEKQLEKENLAMMMKVPGMTDDGWVTSKLESSVKSSQKSTVMKQAGLLNGDSIVTVQWKGNENIDAKKITSEFYAKRASSKNFSEVVFTYALKSDLAVKLPHLYFYTLPVCIGDCYHNLGEYSKALQQYQKASQYKFINTSYEVPSLWLKVAQNYLQWGNSLFKDEEVQDALNIYSNIIKPDDSIKSSSPLYSAKLDTYGSKVAAMIADIENAEGSSLNPAVTGVVLDVRAQLKKIAAGLDFYGFPANYVPVFKFEYLQSVAQYFAQQAIQAERQYIDFTNRGENEELTRQQLQDSVELGKAEVALAGKEVEYAKAELDVARENLEYADERIKNAKDAKSQYADVSYELTALDAASVFASGPEGYKVSYTYYSPSEGKNVTLSGSDAYKVMEDAAWRKGMLSREMELANMQRHIDELEQAKQVAKEQKEAAQKRVEVAEEQRKMAKLHEQQAKEMLSSFESQLFTPEVWFQIASHMRYISSVYLARAIGVAKKMEKAYEFETGELLNIIKNSYTTNILSGLLAADYLLKDIDYFTFHLIQATKSKDIPLKQTLSLAALNPAAFSITFKKTGRLEFETSLEDFDMNYPGAYLRKIKKVEVVIEGLLPPEGVTGTLRNSGLSKDRKATGEEFFRVQPKEVMFVSQYNVRQDFGIFPPDSKMLGVFEHCGVATSWAFELPPSSNDLNYQTISDVKVIMYYTARHDRLLESKIRSKLPKKGQSSMAIPFRVLFPDEFFAFLDTGELSFELAAADLPYNEKNHSIKGLAVKVSTEQGTSAKGITIELVHDNSTSGKKATDKDGMVRLDKDEASNPLNAFEGKELTAPWTVRISKDNNPGLALKKIRDLFMFAEYAFDYRETA